MHIKKTMDCVSQHEKGCIPSIKEVMKGEYAFNPCPPELKGLPMDPEFFLHLFMTPGCDTGGVAAEVLPKKLYSPLAWNYDIHTASNQPRGWGFYIVEGIDWEFSACFVGVMMTAITVLTMAWSVISDDIQSGTSIGQYCIGGLALLMTVFALASGANTGAF